MPDVVIAAESPRQEPVIAMIAALDSYLQKLYPAEVCHLLDLDSLTAPDVRFFVARKGGHPVGCAALRIDAEGYGEVKRMYVLPTVRGAGIAARLLARVEEQARAEGLTALLLETGPLQTEAVALYREAGFTERGPYADYFEHPLSLFLEKAL
ncbi:GNAT family N-acetyltransferase [Azospirillum doebereinerae]